jgi:hypothetical protein
MLHRRALDRIRSEGGILPNEHLCDVATSPSRGSTFPPLEAPAEDSVGGGRRDTGRGKDHSKIRDLFADERCSQAVLDFLSTTDVGRRVPNLAEEFA